uniref:Protein translocase subunit SecA n=1 Tax=Climaconeis sp. TaxID=2846830 RepID=A0A8F8X7D5_9STRA|nr:subunit A of preprotein-translocase [Climaconeis sp.]
MLRKKIHRKFRKLKYKNLVSKINMLESKFKILTDSELKSKSIDLKQQYQFNKNLNSLIVEAFALTREASLRTLGLRHFDAQLIGGLTLNNQKIAEMKTGEGKTLAATLPAFLNALTDKGVQIITVNDYLANRDQISMGQIYRFLGLTTGLINNKMEIFERKENYNANITYVTNDELAFDFLRDNMVFNLNDIVLRSFNYCIIDEVDSILIDEAQTPLIISNPIKSQSDKYFLANTIANYLKYNAHYTVDEKNKSITLTEEGIKRSLILLETNDLYNLNDPYIPYIINALKASTLYVKNTHYIIQDNQIVIVDEFTGRVMPDRRWSGGLHQAIETKENLEIREETETVASISYQNFFLLYNKLSGMTGTGKTAEVEFKRIYKLRVEEIESSSPSQRKDLIDLIYKDQLSKWNAIAQECSKISATGQPILIGTTTIEKSEMLAKLLNEYKLNYKILNAKPENIRKEARIISQAGKQNSITIATNMAGRGTDIILGGNIVIEIQKKVYDLLIRVRNNKILIRSTNYKNFLNSVNFLESSQKCLSILISLLNDKIFLKLSDLEIFKILQENNNISDTIISYQSSIKFLINSLIQYYKKYQEQENKVVKNLGGLYIIGTERNDSKRIDNQLRGRCGRQGDPGISRFFLSLDDTLLDLFGGERVRNFAKTILFDDSPLEFQLITNSLDSAQKSLEEQTYQARKNLFDYEKVLNTHRKLVYKERKKNLINRITTKSVLTFQEQILTEFYHKSKKKNNSNNKKIENLKIRFIDDIDTTDLINKNNFSTFINLWSNYSIDLIQTGLYINGHKFIHEKNTILLVIDKTWYTHLRKISLLREAVSWRGYGQRTPLYEYKVEAAYLFRHLKMIYRQIVIDQIIYNNSRI